MILIANQRHRPLLVPLLERPFGGKLSARRVKQLYDCPFTSLQIHHARLIAAKDNETSLYKVLKIHRGTCPKHLVRHATLQRWIAEILAERT